jgi:hypothetical protein
VRQKSESISFRLPKDQLDRLRQEAEEKRITLNTLVSQMVDSHVNYISSASKANLLPISKELIMELLEAIDDEDKIKEIAKRTQNKVTKEITMLLRGEYSFEAVIDSFEYWLKIGGLVYKHIRDGTNEKKHTFIVQFNVGMKFSFFMAEYLKAAFEPLVVAKIECAITDNIVAITVEGK